MVVYLEVISARIFMPKMTLIKRLLLVAALCVYAGANFAGEIEDADAAMERKEFVKAYNKYIEAAVHGDVSAMYQLGWMLHSGTGVKSDVIKAVGWYRKAATGGNSDAQYILGVMSRVGGEAVVKNPAEALRMYTLAAKQNHVDAQYSLANMYRDGDGVDQDYEIAAQWYKKAAKSSNTDAQIALADMYSEGKGVALSHSSAVYWYKLAAQQGSTYAFFHLANAYRKGLGVLQDSSRAYMWANIYVFKRDGRLGDAEWRDSIAESLTPHQIADAQKMARECLARDFKNCD